MAGACPPALSTAIANAGGFGACGALLSSPEEILSWAQAFRDESDGMFQMNLWTRDEDHQRDHEAEEQMRMFLNDWGPLPRADAGEVTLPDLDAQFDAIVSVKPKALSSIMGVFSPEKVQVLNLLVSSIW